MRDYTIPVLWAWAWGSSAGIVILLVVLLWKEYKECRNRRRN